MNLVSQWRYLLTVALAATILTGAMTADKVYAGFGSGFIQKGIANRFEYHR
jgi:hypothetical protein